MPVSSLDLSGRYLHSKQTFKNIRLRSCSAWCCLLLATHLLPAGLLHNKLEDTYDLRHAAAKQDRQAKRLCNNADKCTQTPKNYCEKVQGSVGVKINRYE